MNLIKSLASIMTVAVLAGCSSNPVNVEIIKLKEQGLIFENSKVYVAQISENPGASFSVNISANSFQTKANTSGTPAKTVDNIARYKVYLLKKPTAGAYASTDDPFSHKVNATAFTINKTGTTQTITFAGVPATTGSESYHVAVLAEDSSNANLVKPNNGGTAWAGTSAGMNMSVDSTTGVTVSASLVPNPTTNIPVNLNLLDGTGAGISADVTTTPGNGPTNSTITAS